MCLYVATCERGRAAVWPVTPALGNGGPGVVSVAVAGDICPSLSFYLYNEGDGSAQANT